MNRTDKQAPTCWRCRRCGFITPMGQDICGNSSCRADLSLYGEPVTPVTEQDAAQDSVSKDHPHDESRGSTANLWEEQNQTETITEKKKRGRKDKEKRRTSGDTDGGRVEKKKPNKEKILEEGSGGPRKVLGPVIAFFLSVLIIVVSVVAGVALGYVAFALSYQLYSTFPWFAVGPGMVLVALTLVITWIVLRDRNHRRAVYTRVGIWLLPFAVLCWRKFSFLSGDEMELFAFYLVAMFTAEPLLVGSVFMEVKGALKAATLLRRLGATILVFTGIIAVVLVVGYFYIRFGIGLASVLDGVLSLIVYVAAHVGAVVVMHRRGKKYMETYVS